MDGDRFDELARSLASRTGAASRRGLLRGALAAVAAAVVGRSESEAAGSPTCPTGQVYRRSMGCVCRKTGRAPGPNGCTACAEGRERCGGSCVDTRTARDHCGGCNQPCRSRDGCETAQCRGGVCRREPLACPTPGECQSGLGVCDPGTGLCGYTARTGVQCGPAAACVTGVQSVRGTCGANGACQPGAATSCSPYRCDDDGIGCRTTCRGDADCLPAYHCDEIDGVGRCIEDIGRGLACDEASDCAAGLFCVEGVCCDKPCVPCGTCTLTGSVGTCVGDPVVVCADCHACDLDTGQCAPRDGGSCDPINACFTAGTCQGGTCGGTTTIGCPPRTPCELPGVCNPTTEACEYEDAADGSACTPDGGGDGRCCVGTCCPGAGGCCDSGACGPTCAAPLVLDPAACTCVCPLDRQCGGACCAAGTSCADAELSTCCASGTACRSASGPFCCPNTDDDCYADDAGTRALCCPADSHACELGSDFFCCADDHVCLEQGSGGLCCPACQNGTAPQLNCTCCPPGATACPDGSCCGQCQVCNPLGEGCVPTPAPGPVSCTPADRCFVSGICDGGSCLPLTATSCPVCQTCDPADGACTPVADGTPVEPTDSCGDVCLGGLPVDRPGCGECETCEVVTGACAPTTGGACSLGTCCDGACCSTGNCCASGGCAALCLAPYQFDPDVCDCLCPDDVECCADADCPVCHSCNSADGLCQPVANGLACADGNLCRVDAVCVLGDCVGTSVDCGACKTCDPTTGSCVNDDGESCLNADACLGPGICGGGACQSLSPVICPACSACDPSSGACQPTSVGACTPIGGAIDSGICCSGACCPPGTQCQGTTCVPIACPTCQVFDATADACAPIDDGTFCLTPESAFSQCCDGACCLEGQTCVAGACCDNFLVCGSVCCSRCETCQGGTCVPLGEGAQCAFYFGNRYACCDGVCCEENSCSADVCGLPLPS